MSHGDIMRLVSIVGDSISTFEGFNPPGYAVFYDKEMIERNGLRTVYDTWWAKVNQALHAFLCVNILTQAALSAAKYSRQARAKKDYPIYGQQITFPISYWFILASMTLEMVLKCTGQGGFWPKTIHPFVLRMHMTICSRLSERIIRRRWSCVERLCVQR